MARNWRLSNSSTTPAKRKPRKPRASGPKDRRKRKRPKLERQRLLQKRKKRAAARNNQDNQRVSAEASAEAPSVDRGRHDRGRRRHRNPPRHLEPSINMNELREL